MITATSVNSLLAQLVRVSGLHPGGRWFESNRDYLFMLLVYKNES